MSGSSFFPKLCFALAAAVGLALGLTTYTFPIFGHVRDPAVAALIHQALHDSVQPLPGPPSELEIQAVVATPIFPDEAADSGPAPAPAQPTAWVARAAARDPGALRDWLTHSGLFTGTAEGDTVRSTLWRLTLRSGCPLISRFRTVSTRLADRLVEISSDCPRVATRSGDAG